MPLAQHSLDLSDRLHDTCPDSTGAPAMDVSTWLRDLGLENYVQDFQANDVDAEVLLRLTAEDLVAIGVISVGHRRRLLDAIAVLQERTAPAAVQPVAMAVPRAADAERRQLTVLFCDLVGSTELAERLDPEDLRDLMRDYQAACADVISRFEGHVAKFLGDGVLAYFGWPKAHEDDAERAVRAGLELVAAVGRLPAGTEARLAARIGIATGQVVVGDLIGRSTADKDSVIGETPNLAARLQALAEPGEVMISQASRRLVGGLFELDDLGPQHLKGFAEPLAVWRVAGEGRAEGRFEARQTGGLTPLVGRDEEISLLLRRWQQAVDGEGQVVLLSGEPGIGKSRLVRELRARLEGEPHLRLLYQCSPHHQTSPLHPVIEQLERAATFERDDPPDVRLAKLETLSARGTKKLDEAAPPIAAVLGLPGGDRYDLPELTPQRQKQLTLEVLVEQLEGLSTGKPVLLVYEDVHWIDPTTQELMGLAIERIQRLAVLAIITFRPEFAPPWSGQPQMSALALTRLGRRDGAVLVERVVGAKALPAEVSAQIVGKTDGVPLFVEELTKTVLESGLLRDAGDRYELAGPLPPLAIPSTLHDSLLARLDRSAPVKEIAQIGAAIGREFSHDLLSAVSRLDDPALDDALSDLSTAELIFRRSMPPNAAYAFKHVLVRDAAYASLLRGKRQHIHGRIAAALSELATDCPPEVMAHHLTEAGQTEASVEFWARAGQQAVSRAASKEAAAHFRRALAQLLTLPDTIERKRREAILQSALGGALAHVAGLASEAIAEAYARARDLCQQTGDTKPRFIAEWNLWHIHILRDTEHRHAQALAKRLMGVAEREDDPDLQLQALHAEWSTLCLMGEHSAAQACCERGWALYDPERHGSHHLTYGAHDPGVCSRMQGASETWCLGQPDRARAFHKQGLALAHRLSHPQILLHALVRGLPLFQLCRDRERLEAQAETTLRLATEQDSANFRTEAQFMLAWALSGRGEPEQAVRLMQAGLQELQSRSGTWTSPYYLSLLARTQARAGALDDALATLDGAHQHARMAGNAWSEPDLLQIRGELLLEKGKTEAAEQFFSAALGQARATAARAWELRAATSLARLWAEQGKRTQARDLLVPIYGWFTEGFDTADLKDAKALLDGLA
jgi:class 3 adenylate cyclase/predicted ATPase